MKNRYFIEKNSDFHGNDGIHIDFTEGENADFVVDRGHVSNMGVFSVNNNQTDVKGNRIFSSDGILFLFKSLYTKPRVYMDLNVEGDNDVEEKINKQLKAITEYNSIKEKYGLSGSIFAFNGHGADKTICFIGKDGSAKALLTVSDLAKALLQSYKNGANLEEITLDLSSCFSYNFAKNLIKELKELEEKEGLQIKYPQILSSAGQETELSTSFSYKNNNTGQFAMYIDNMASAILENLQQINRNGESPDSLSFDFIFNSEIDTSNHTIFISGQDVANVNANFRQKLFGILGESFIEKHEVEKTIQTAQLQLPFTQKVLNKIGNSGIIKSIYKEKSGDNFRFTKLGVAIGVLLETIAFWMPNFVKAHNFDPSIQTKMTAVVWVIRALSIGLGFGVGSIWALLLTETITHYIWNRLSIRAGKKNLLLQTSENLTKEQLIQKIFDVSNIDRDYKENIEDKQKLESLLNKEQIFETDIKFVLQEKDFITDDSLLNYQKINFFFKVLNLVREKGFNVDDDLYEQIMFLMDVFTYEQS
ncbi:MAG: hypothetical protein II090_00775, partial [Elusimicrobia bacterium]|nr:hypothetical protein [Elusimicrobiota bacterium]